MEAITANYAEHADDWSVTVTGRGEELTEHAPGIIAARDRAEQLIESLKPETGDIAVVHLLRGSALEFTTAYMTARLGRETGEGATDSDEGLVPRQARGEPEQQKKAAGSAGALGAQGSQDTEDAQDAQDAQDAESSEDGNSEDGESPSVHAMAAESTVANARAASDDNDAAGADETPSAAADSAQELAQQ